MEKHLEQIRDQQKDTWNTFSGGWKKWDNFVLDFLKPAGDEIIQKLDLHENEVVLDIATGTGEPGLSIARIVNKGKVIGVDIAESMLKNASEKAEKNGILNYETRVCDVSELPFPDETFDAISCRMGFMFFPDMNMAAREIYRVLKPGGKFACSVWSGPEKNFWISSIMGTIQKIMQTPTPPPGVPGMFRCAGPEFMSTMLKQAGFKNVEEKEINPSFLVESHNFFWEYMNDVAAPVVAAMKTADESTRQKIKDEVFALLKEKYPEQPGLFYSSSIIIYGMK
jgi:ubiquinone/menaquinone biosynthesis C-methylase UbiE